MAKFDGLFEALEESHAATASALAEFKRRTRYARTELQLLVPEEGEEMVALPKDDIAARQAALRHLLAASFKDTVFVSVAPATEMHAESVGAEAVAESMVAAGEVAAEARMCMKCGVKERHGGHYCAECGEQHPHCRNCGAIFAEIGGEVRGYKGSGLCKGCYEMVDAELNAPSGEPPDVESRVCRECEENDAQDGSDVCARCEREIRKDEYQREREAEWAAGRGC